MDICVPTCCVGDVRCLDVLLRSLEVFADLASYDLLVSCNSGDQATRKLLTAVCAAHPARSLNIDFFEPKETHGSQQHGESLNRLFARTTSKHVIVADADVIVTSPEWLGFCKRHIDDGYFIVGTPYREPQLMWQGNFPNVWCTMIDGESLRTAKLDMRPWGDAAIEDIVGAHGYFRSSEKCDTSWRMAEYGLKNGLKYLGLKYLSATGSELSRLLYVPPTAGATSRRNAHNRRAKSARIRMARLRAMEFAYPGTDDVCCAHLVRAIRSCWNRRNRRRSRIDEWVFCANMVIDAVKFRKESSDVLLLAALLKSKPKKLRPKMTKGQRRGRAT